MRFMRASAGRDTMASSPRVSRPSSNAAAVTTLARGQTIAQVVSILGAPARAVDLGAKQIYLYQNMKVTFLYGRMSDVI